MNQADRQRAELAVRWTQAQPGILAFLRTLVRDPVEVDDLLQEVAYRAAMRFDDYDPTRPFVAWAIGIARLVVLEWRRRRQRDPLVLDADAIARLADAYAARLPDLERGRLALESCIQKATPSARRLLDLRYRHDMSPADIAAELNSTPASVSSMLHRAREVLRQCIQRALREQAT
ncbi:sigma-70 family RNA polymerase sigma factor [Planctomycetales bacterium ZRK34]|nr:sigma-70 family RNA polymerase sigma factor [Planctomycetales bacterium ZRK34]